ncbi:MAG: hypothetical protein A2133_04110 [Actinobacteria bacterium RBG_16_64_13]|nr:MAG: hypothetical protein A2133_04110 [Actinobacteria bacterium RBG_16_64_13]
MIWGLVMAVIYFVLIQYLWKSSGTPTATNAIVAVIGFVLFAAIVYGVDHFKYQRYLRKQKSSNK